MADSGARAPLAALVLVFGATLAAYMWQQRHAGAPDVATVTPPAPLAPPTASPAPPKMGEASTPTEAPKPPAPEAKAGEPPHFDVVRVEPGGAAVIAGKGEPGAKVELLASGKVVAEAKADPGGNFVILPSNLMPGGYDLTLRQTLEGKAPVESTQSVAVSIPTKGSDQVVVALSEPGKATKLLSTKPLPARPVVPQTPMVLPAPTQPTPPSPAPEVVPPAPPPPPAATSQAPKVATVPPAITAPPPGVSIRSVELENGNGFFASGAAAAGANVRIYLNDTPLADVVAGPDGQWTVTIKRGLAGGHYTVRADAGSDAVVAARAEVPFDVPAAMAQAAPATPSAERAPEPPSAPNPGDAVTVPAPASPSVSVHEAASAPSSAPPAPRPDLAAAKATPAPPAANPTKQAEAVPQAPTQAPTEAPAATPRPNANAVIEQVETAVVVSGDNLWNISRARLGHGRRFTQIYAANTSQIRNPRLIYPGQVLVVPPR